MIKITNLVKKYGALAAVNGVSLEIAPGEIFGLLGPNGAGKTSTIAMISGLLKATSGTVRIDGLDTRQSPQTVKHLVGLVPQDLALYQTITARDNLRFFGRLYGITGLLLKQRIREALEVVGLTERADHVVMHYSGGMKRRLNLACGLLHRPKLLLLDEPTVGVDPQSRNAIFENVRQLNREWGMTIIYTTHYMEEAQDLCGKVAIMDQGKIVALDTPKNLIAKQGGGVVTMVLGQKAPAGLAEKVAALPLVSAATGHDRTLQIQTQQTQQALAAILALLQQQGTVIENLQIQEANLESVFLHLTGKSLRDENAPSAIETKGGMPA